MERIIRILGVLFAELALLFGQVVVEVNFAGATIVFREPFGRRPRTPSPTKPPLASRSRFCPRMAVLMNSGLGI